METGRQRYKRNNLVENLLESRGNGDGLHSSSDFLYEIIVRRPCVSSERLDNGLSHFGFGTRGREQELLVSTLDLSQLELVGTLSERSPPFSHLQNGSGHT